MPKKGDCVVEGCRLDSSIAGDDEVMDQAGRLGAGSGSEEMMGEVGRVIFDAIGIHGFHGFGGGGVELLAKQQRGFGQEGLTDQLVHKGRAVRIGMGEADEVGGFSLRVRRRQLVVLHADHSTHHFGVENPTRDRRGRQNAASCGRYSFYRIPMTIRTVSGTSTSSTLKRVLKRPLSSKSAPDSRKWR